MQKSLGHTKKTKASVGPEGHSYSTWCVPALTFQELLHLHHIYSLDFLKKNTDYGLNLHIRIRSHYVDKWWCDDIKLDTGGKLCGYIEAVFQNIGHNR